MTADAREPKPRPRDREARGTSAWRIALPLLALVACDKEHSDALDRDIAFLMVIAIAALGAHVVVFVANVYQRLNGNPKVGWSVAAIALGLVSTGLILVDGHAIWFLPGVFTAALGLIGVSNLIARRRLERTGQLPTPMAKPSAPSGPMPPPGSRAPPWP